LDYSSVLYELTARAAYNTPVAEGKEPEDWTFGESTRQMDASGTLGEPHRLCGRS
jgi:hypothetical protein